MVIRFNKGFLVALTISIILWILIGGVSLCFAQQHVTSDSIIIVVDSVKYVDVYYNKSQALLDSIEYLKPMYEIWARKVTVENDTIVPDSVLIILGTIKFNAVIFDLSIIGKGKWNFGYRAISAKKGVLPSDFLWSLDKNGKLVYINYDPLVPLMVRKIRIGRMIGVGIYKR